MFDRKAYNKAWAEAHKEERRAYRRNYHLAHKPRQNELCRIYHRQHKDEIHQKKHPYLVTYRKENQTQIKAYAMNYRHTHKQQIQEQQITAKRILKTEVLTHYGNGTLACVRCGQDHLAALSIDHINGAGTQHRKTTTGPQTYKWLKEHGYPDGYQTLCMSCQFIKAEENRERFKRHTLLSEAPIETPANEPEHQPQQLALAISS